jgi:hypothetical protein
MKPDAYQQLLDEARRAGATITLTGSGHWKIAKGSEIVFASQTPSDNRAVANLRAELRRHGLLQRSRFRLTDAEQALLVYCIDQEQGVRLAKQPPKRLLDKGFVRTARRCNGWMVWITDKGRAFMEDSWV